MRILITGNMGYVGPVVTRHLRAADSGHVLAGLDTGYYGTCLSAGADLPERHLAVQHYADVRRVPDEALEGVEAIVHLAGISNDPIGTQFEAATFQINHAATVRLAQQARRHGVRSFVFASSCSIYGAAGQGACTETSALNPLTAYAQSKVRAERDLQPLADERFTITCLRFSTACGMSDRLRLDLVLNDFVAAAVASGRIAILSDGTPWRPLINVKDMARAIEWAAQRPAESGGPFLAVNVGRNDWNYQVKDLASAVAAAFPGVEVSINRNAQPDKRSYRVSFDLFERLAPSSGPRCDLAGTIQELKEGMESMGFADPDFRNSQFIRLRALSRLRERGLLDGELNWIETEKPQAANAA